MLGAAAGAWALGHGRGHASPPAASLAAPALAPAAAAPAVALAGTVTASEAARWSQAREDGVERVRLDEGALSIHVRPQRAGERFLVELPDGEIEVRGTTFDVVVEGAHTTAVRVAEGVVELRLAGEPARRLAAGERWVAGAGAPPAAPPAAAVAPAVSAAAPVAVRAPLAAKSGEVAAPAPVEADDGAAQYAQALALLSAGDNDRAAAALRAFVESRPGAAQAEDASYLEAVALARAGRADAAGLAAEHHLTRFPASFHRKEALVLVERAARLRDGGAR